MCILAPRCLPLAHVKDLVNFAWTAFPVPLKTGKVTHSSPAVSLKFQILKLKGLECGMRTATIWCFLAKERGGGGEGVCDKKEHPRYTFFTIFLLSHM